MLVQKVGDGMRGKVKDDSVFRMLESERDRCAHVIEKLLAEIEKLPEGSLGQRKVKTEGKEYVYQCLRYRDGKQVKFVHLSAGRAEELRPALERKKKLQKDLSTTRKRMNTINGILQKR